MEFRSAASSNCRHECLSIKYVATAHTYLGKPFTSDGKLHAITVHSTLYDILTNKTTQIPLPDDVTVPLVFYRRFCSSWCAQRT